MKPPADWLLEKRRANDVKLLQVTVWEADVSREGEALVNVLTGKRQEDRKDRLGERDRGEGNKVREKERKDLRREGGSAERDRERERERKQRERGREHRERGRKHREGERKQRERDET